MCNVHSFPHNIKYFITWEILQSECMLEKTIVEENVFYKTRRIQGTIKSIGDAQAQEILKCVVECLVSKRGVIFQYFLSWVREFNVFT